MHRPTVLTHSDTVPSAPPIRRIVTKRGYVILEWRTDDTFVWAYEHRVVMGLPAGHVHHVNGVKSDNRRENLEVLEPRQHMRRHHPQQWDRAEATKLYTEGATLPQVSQALGVHSGNISRGLREVGVAMRQPWESRHPIDLAAVAEFRCAGWTYAKIAAHMGYHQRALMAALRRERLKSGGPRLAVGKHLETRA